MITGTKNGRQGHLLLAAKKSMLIFFEHFSFLIFQIFLTLDRPFKSVKSTNGLASAKCKDELEEKK